MVLTTMQSIAIIAVCGICTLLERALPFLIFSGRAVPEPVRYLGRVLPMAIMATLVIYCLKGISFSSAAGFAPLLIASAVTAILHLWKRSTLISILWHCLLYGSGAACICIILHNFNRKTLRIFSIRRVLFFNFLIVIFGL